jgi:SPP1 family predicted phage head-tail adaptor
MDDIIEILSTEIVQDEYGVERETVTPRGVFAERRSVTRAEFYSAGRAGLNPEFMFRVFRGDYHGEPTIRYQGKGYSVYRVYDDGSDYLELYVQREGGTNGK